MDKPEDIDALLREVWDKNAIRPNPHLKHYAIYGFDQFNKPKTHYMTIGPPLYFWLGRDAYPEPRRISRIVSDDESPSANISPQARKGS